jgi:hypothetical protein
MVGLLGGCRDANKPVSDGAAAAFAAWNKEEEDDAPGR